VEMILRRLSITWTGGKLLCTSESWKVRGTCRHLERGQILITTDAHRYFDCRSLRMGSQKSGVGRRPFIALSSS